ILSDREIQAATFRGAILEALAPGVRRARGATRMRREAIASFPPEQQPPGPEVDNPAPRAGGPRPGVRRESQALGRVLGGPRPPTRLLPLEHVPELHFSRRGMLAVDDEGEVTPAGRKDRNEEAKGEISHLCVPTGSHIPNAEPLGRTERRCRACGEINQPATV